MACVRWPSSLWRQNRSASCPSLMYWSRKRDNFTKFVQQKTHMDTLPSKGQSQCDLQNRSAQRAYLRNYYCTYNTSLMPTRPMDTHTGPQMEFLRSQVIPNRQTGDAKLSYVLCKKISLIFCQLNVLNPRNAALQNTSSHVSITEVWCTHTRAHKNEMIYASTSGH